jgi:nucleoid-associated protein YgaU
MNRNVGVSFGLSLLTVVFFAVILYHPDRPPPTPAAVATVEPVEAHAPPDAEPVPAKAVATKAPAGSTPSAGLARAEVAPAVPKRSSTPGVKSARAIAVTRPVSQRAIDIREARGAFTQVRPGESLADVASRVYGSPDSTRTLWLANRDMVDRADTPLSPGALLRTP